MIAHSHKPEIISVLTALALTQTDDYQLTSTPPWQSSTVLSPSENIIRVTTENVDCFKHGTFPKWDSDLSGLQTGELSSLNTQTRFPPIHTFLNQLQTSSPVKAGEKVSQLLFHLAHQWRAVTKLDSCRWTFKISAGKLTHSVTYIPGISRQR